MHRPGTRLTLLLLVAMSPLVLAAPALAEGIVGMRLSVTNVDQMTGDVTFDVTALADVGGAMVTLGDPLDDSGLVTYTTNYDFGLGYGGTPYRVRLTFNSDWNTVPHPAIVYGDGDQVDTATLAFQGTTDVGGATYNVYRAGSFVHSYAQGSYTLQAIGDSDGALNDPGLGRATTVTPVDGIPVTGTLQVDFEARRTLWRTATYPGSPIFQYTITSAQTYPWTVRYLTARQDIEITGDGGGGGGGGGTVPEVPTLSPQLLLVLAALLGLAGVALLRR
ncbi:MAG: hypothetical protein AAGC60_27235 [Acidobacteriota bacterium]